MKIFFDAEEFSFGKRCKKSAHKLIPRLSVSGMMFGKVYSAQSPPPAPADEVLKNSPSGRKPSPCRPKAKPS